MMVVDSFCGKSWKKRRTENANTTCPSQAWSIICLTWWFHASTAKTVSDVSLHSQKLLTPHRIHFQGGSFQPLPQVNPLPIHIQSYTAICTLSHFQSETIAFGQNKKCTLRIKRGCIVSKLESLARKIPETKPFRGLLIFSVFLIWPLNSKWCIGSRFSSLLL